MRRTSRLELFLACLVPIVAQAALPQRTFVASNGLDTNPCSLTSPCRGFDAAVTAVADHGEVVVLDSAGYGVVTIGKSVSIVAPAGVYAGVSVSSGDGITIDGASIIVALRGLSIANQGGGNGIAFLQGASLHVENCVISGSGASIGINVSALGSVTHVVDSIVRENGSGIVFGGILVGNVSRTRVERNGIGGITVTGHARVSIEDSVVTANDTNISAAPFLAGEHARVTVARTLVAGGTYGIIARPDGPSASAEIIVTDSTIANTGAAAIFASQTFGTPTVTAIRNQLQGNAIALWADGPSATLILDGNALAGNVAGVFRTLGATIMTRGNNTVNSNGTDTTGTPYTPLTGI